MPYEPEKDQAIQEEFIQAGETRFKVGIYSYNAGEKKIGMIRSVRKRDGTDSFAPLGRLRKTEAEAIRDALSKLIPLLEG